MAGLRHFLLLVCALATAAAEGLRGAAANGTGSSAMQSLLPGKAGPCGLSSNATMSVDLPHFGELIGNESRADNLTNLIVASDSCAYYGCGSFLSRQACQCNSLCEQYGTCCYDYKAECKARLGSAHARLGSAHSTTLKLYHQTSPDICALILESNFRKGTKGWCGGGIYFAVTPEDTNKKAIGPDSHTGCIIQATVNVGLVKSMSQTCDRSMTGDKLHLEGFDSIRFNPGDGDEYVVYSSLQVVSMDKYE